VGKEIVVVKGQKIMDLSNITITDSLLGHYCRLVSDKIIPYQWNLLNDANATHCIENYRIAAGKQGESKGVVFQDSDLYKWIEAVAFCIENGSGDSFILMAEEAIDLIEQAQEEDGYLNTYFTLNAPQKKWTNLVEGHELYCAGHLIEAAVAYYKATRRTKLLTVARKNADLICRVFGNGEGQIPGYPGHQVIELALMKLYHVTNDDTYLNTARYFLYQRGKEPNYFLEEMKKRNGIPEFFHEFTDYDLRYSQTHTDILHQETAEGHAVRAMYMFSAMADVAMECRDEELLQACKRLWENVTTKKMYITGSVGSSGYLERFTTDYNLPNHSNYSETCASIGLMMFGQRMAKADRGAEYYDVVERALYNTVLAGVNLTGDRYFYVNPLEVVPDYCMDHTDLQHVKPNRQRWFSVACCPPNVARTLASLGQYLYEQDGTDLYIHLFISSTLEAEIAGRKFKVTMDSSIVQQGTVQLKITEEQATDIAQLANVTIKIRVPEYARGINVEQDGEKKEAVINKGYLCFDINFSGTHTIFIDFNVRPRWVAANDKVRADEGKMALMNGPLVYCLEQIDNGENLAGIYVRTTTQIRMLSCEKAPCGELPIYEYQATRLANEGVKGQQLYGEPDFVEREVWVKAVPYCLWNNRGQGEMLVWQKVKL